MHSEARWHWRGVSAPPGNRRRRRKRVHCRGGRHIAPQRVAIGGDAIRLGYHATGGRRTGSRVVGRHARRHLSHSTRLHEHAAARTRWERLGRIRLPFLSCLDTAIFKAFFNRTKGLVGPRRDAQGRPTGFRGGSGKFWSPRWAQATNVFERLTVPQSPDAHFGRDRPVLACWADSSNGRVTATGCHAQLYADRAASSTRAARSDRSNNDCTLIRSWTG